MSSTFAEAEAQIGRFIADVYNAKRLHSALGDRPPNEFEALVRAVPVAGASDHALMMRIILIYRR